MKPATPAAVLTIFALLLSFGAPALADHAFAHTHIGVNPTWRPDWSNPSNPDLATDTDDTDNNQLWLFSVPPIHPVAPTPGWPEWGDPSRPLSSSSCRKPMRSATRSTSPATPARHSTSAGSCMVKTGYGDPDGYQHLDGWHSAHGPQGVWNLASVDQETEPEWDIGLRRESTSMADPTDFVMIRPDESTAMESDGATYKFSDYNEVEWVADENAWGLHSHMTFNFWLDDPQPDEIYTATFTAFDDGDLYTDSDPFTFRFAVPEPASLSLIVLAGLFITRRR